MQRPSRSLSILLLAFGFLITACLVNAVMRNTPAKVNTTSVQYIRVLLVTAVISFVICAAWIIVFFSRSVKLFPAGCVITLVCWIVCIPVICVSWRRSI